MLSYFFSWSSNNTKELRELKDESLFVSILIKKYPNHKYISYRDQNSSSYKTITTWCNIDKDLRTIPKSHLLTTHNGLLYDKDSKSFIEISEALYDKCVHPCLSNIYPQDYLNLITEVEADCNVFLESDIPQELIEEMEEIGAIGPRMTVMSQYLKDGWGNALK